MTVVGLICQCLIGLGSNVVVALGEAKPRLAVESTRAMAFADAERSGCSVYIIIANIALRHIPGRSGGFGDGGGAYGVCCDWKHSSSSEVPQSWK